MNFPGQEKQADAYFAEGQYAKAAELYEQAIAIAPDVMSNYWHLGLMLLLQGQEAEAQMVWLSAMLQGTPEQVELWTADLIKVLDAEAQRREVIGDLATDWLIRQHIREVAPDYLDNLLRTILVALKMGLFVPGEDAALRKATELVRREPILEIDSSLLLDVLQQVWSFDASNCYIVEFADACIRHYQIALQDSPDRVVTLMNLSKLNWVVGKLEEAIASYNQVIKITPDYAPAHLNQGHIFTQQIKNEEAIASFQTALQVSPNLAEAHLNLGNILKQQGKINEALTHYKKILEINPNHPEAYFNIGEIMAHQEQGKAIICLYKALESKPNYTEAYLKVADILYQQEKFEEIIGCYQKVLEIEPTSTETQCNLARVYFRQGKNTEGFELTRQALQLPPYNLDLEQIQNPDFWQSINPQLSIGKDREVKSETNLIFEEKQLKDILFYLKQEGYFQIDSLIPHSEVERLAVGIERLQQHQIRPVFILVYDEVWQIFQRLSPLISAVLGSAYQQISFWAWYLDPQKAESGWEPHRDRLSSVRPDGMTDTVNVWIALTDATPLNGCMYIVPANCDRSYGHRVSQPDFSLQSIRALPAPAGSILGWNGQVWHWGGRSSSKAARPRISMAMEFQRVDVAPYEHLLLDPFVQLSLSERLGLSGLYLLSYQER